jgi:hypothetical protein
MKNTSLFLILIVVLCRIGLGGDFCHSHILQTISEYPTNHQDEISISKGTTNSYSDNKASNHEICMCNDALPNALHDHQHDLKSVTLYLASVKLPNTAVNKVSSSHLQTAIKREYLPHQLFLANSSFLL